MREIGKADYFKPELAPVREAGPYDVTIVYFMDYQCPACRKYAPDVTRALNEDRKVRVIYRDTPIFGPRSEEAARVAVASAFQGKHEAMHLALMQSPMPLDEQALQAAAKKAGVDWDRLQRDLKTRSDEIDLQIAWNMELARGAGIAGTPAFIIGDTLANGTLNYEGLKASIADARAQDRSKAAPAIASSSRESVKPVKQTVADPEATSEKAAAPAAATPQPRRAAEALTGAPDSEPAADQKRSLAWSWIAGLAAAFAAMLLFARKRLARGNR
jgi:predicted DsbA family dithiol-disulfide isomerase